MSISIPTMPRPDWAILLAQYLRLPFTTVQSLIAEGKLPTEGCVPRDPTIPVIYHDALAVAALEQYRDQFDTPLPGLVAALNSLAGELLDGRNEHPHEHALTEFRFYDRQRDAAYALTPRHRPWRDQRCPVTRAELDAAGYRQLAALFNRPRQDAYGFAGGECRLGPPGWAYKSPTVRPDLRVPRGAFLARLAFILSRRDADQVVTK